MSWNFHDTELEQELRQEKACYHDQLVQARQTIKALRHHCDELEKQLEPSVVQEIRDELNAQQQEQEQ